MKISVLCQSRFHAFAMAKYFQERGFLHELVTGYPKMAVSRFGLKTHHVKSVLVNELINRVTYRIFGDIRFAYYADTLFDRIAAWYCCKDSDVYVLFSGAALHSIHAIRRRNPHALIVLVRASAHIETQEVLLRQMAGSNKQIIDPKKIVKELAEYRLADYIMVPSSFAENSFLDKGFPRGKIFTNLLGVDLNEFPFYPKKDRSADQMVVGNVGAISKQKNVAGIIRVVASLNEKGLRIKLVLAGAVETGFPTSLLNLPFVDYRGKMPQNQLHELYKEMDVFVINSVQEGLAMVQLQAMSCGLPIISTVNAGGLDLVKDGVNGFVIPILDDAALAQKMAWFYYNQDQIPTMGAQSRQYTETGLSWDDFGERNVRFFKRALCERTPASLRN